MKTLVLEKNRDRSVRRRHPWIFSGAVARADAGLASGETVLVRAHDGEALGRGAWSPQSQMRCRLWSFDPAEEIDEAFFARRLDAALAARAGLTGADTDAVRLLHGEADGLPGVVVDRYAEVLVGQFLSAGAERHKVLLADMLRERTGAVAFWERSDTDARRKEGLEPAVGPLAGTEPTARVEIREAGLRYLVDVRGGHKTGFYLDQRPNRRDLGGAVAGAELLDCFSYTGGFALAALRGGAAAVTDVDSSAEALAQAAEHVTLNGLDDGRYAQIEGDVFKVLRELRDRARSFDAIVLDPPKFADSAAALERAARGYKDINLLALKLLRPGGRLWTFSCSAHMTPELFLKVVAGAAVDAGRTAVLERELRQGADHPMLLTFPESLYLKGLVVRVG
ncbi:class I SAM-dependent methyltransferase [bacterium]|nr:class I SAM-dependent methyltransferase [bacterium]MBU1676518.1 class I SAM-dependent methyltransferase [bacterium]